MLQNNLINLLSSKINVYSQNIHTFFIENKAYKKKIKKMYLYIPYLDLFKSISIYFGSFCVCKISIKELLIYKPIYENLYYVPCNIYMQPICPIYKTNHIKIMIETKPVKEYTNSFIFSENIKDIMNKIPLNENIKDIVKKYISIPIFDLKLYIDTIEQILGDYTSISMLQDTNFCTIENIKKQTHHQTFYYDRSTEPIKNIFISMSKKTKYDDIPLYFINILQDIKIICKTSDITCTYDAGMCLLNNKLLFNNELKKNVYSIQLPNIKRINIPPVDDFIECEDIVIELNIKPQWFDIECCIILEFY